MIENYFPNAEDFDEMADHLDAIAHALGEQVDVSDWSGIQKAVKLGIAPKIFPIGTRLTVNHSKYGDMEYTVVAHNHFKNAQSKDAPTMTLMSNNVLPPLIQFDSGEAFYQTDTEMLAGKYGFTIPYTIGEWKAGNYYFTLYDTLPAGASFYFGSTPDEVAMQILVENFSTSTYYTMLHASLGNGDTNLGTFGVELNHTHRIYYGSNNYKESAIRQVLNSTSQAGDWKPQTKYDHYPNWVELTDGFLNGLDSGLRDTIVDVVVPCSANNTFESPDSETTVGGAYTVIDKVFLPSANELGCFGNTISNDSDTLPYFKNASNDMRIKYDKNSTPRFYWTRTPENNTSFGMEIINEGGKATGRKAIEGSYVAPIFNIG